jgi:hypothetical protein
VTSTCALAGTHTIGGQYCVESEAEWQARAKAFIAEHGIEGAFTLLMDPESGLSQTIPSCGGETSCRGAPSRCLTWRRLRRVISAWLLVAA